jgi:very-short-patch-repair endonuclease
LGGFKFKRQVLIGNYIADFVCVERKLVVELDGSQHANQREYDEKRDAFLEAKGFRVVRIWNMELLENPAGVLDMVLAALETAPSP